MSISIKIQPNTYIDSVSLMALSTRANQLTGVDQAIIAMATEMNKEVMKMLVCLQRRLNRHRRAIW